MRCFRRSLMFAMRFVLVKREKADVRQEKESTDTTCSLMFRLLVDVRNGEVSDTTGDARSTAAGYKILGTAKRQENFA